MGALDLVGAVRNVHVRSQITVAVKASFVCDLATGFAYLDMFWVPTSGELCPMIDPVFSFNEVFMNDIVMRRMAVVTGSYPRVRTGFPGGVLRFHDVAVNTSSRIAT